MKLCAPFCVTSGAFLVVVFTIHNDSVGMSAPYTWFAIEIGAKLVLLLLQNCVLLLCHFLSKIV